MDDLVITVTCDASMSYPGFPHMPSIEDTDAVGQQYVDAVNAWRHDLPPPRCPLPRSRHGRGRQEAVDDRP